MRMPGGALRLAGGVLHLAHLVEVDERVEVFQADPGKGAADGKAFALEAARGGGDGADGPHRGVAWIGDGHPGQGERGGGGDGWHCEVYN